MKDYSNNLIHIVAKALADTPLRECFLVIDELIEMAPQIPGVRAEVMRVMEGSIRSARDTMIINYYDLPGSIDATFQNGSEAIVDFNGTAIHVSAKQMTEDGSSYRLLFSRLDGAALHECVHKQIKALTNRIERLERHR